jgi:adenosylcobinamide kinase / adenosylcobinamide-phosphate guanylyltransferase
MLTLILGGARSGKSALAVRRCVASARPVTWVATATHVPSDAEMVARIARHRAERPAHWHTIEEPLTLANVLREAAIGELIVVDCLTLWLSNLMLDADATLLDTQRRALLDTLPTLEAHIILIANETGLGIVPDNALARRFRDEAGWLNQGIAQIADEVIFVAAGLPLTLKSPA